MRVSRPGLSIGARCPSSFRPIRRSWTGAVRPWAQDWHSPSNVLLRGTKVTDEVITARAQYYLSLSNFVLTDTEVPDEGITAWAQYWHSLFSAPV